MGALSRASFARSSTFVVCVAENSIVCRSAHDARRQICRLRGMRTCPFPLTLRQELHNLVHFFLRSRAHGSHLATWAMPQSSKTGTCLEANLQYSVRLVDDQAKKIVVLPPTPFASEDREAEYTAHVYQPGTRACSACDPTGVLEWQPAGSRLLPGDPPRPCDARRP